LGEIFGKHAICHPGGKDYSEHTNYRPIALASCVCKTRERIINAFLAWCDASNGLLFPI